MQLPKREIEMSYDYRQVVALLTKIAQDFLGRKFEIAENETPESLAQKVHEIEYEIFPKAIAKILAE